MDSRWRRPSRAASPAGCSAGRPRTARSGRTAGPDPGLAERAFDEFAYLVKVRAEYPKLEAEHQPPEHRTLVEHYRDYYVGVNEAEPSAELVAAFGAVLEEVAGAAG